MIHSPGRKQDWVEQEMNGKVSGQSRVVKVRAAEDQGGKPLGGLRLGVQRPCGLRAKSAKSVRTPERGNPLF